MNPEITATELKTRMDNGEKPNVIDVREEWEYDEVNIGVKNIPLGELPNRLDEIESLKDEELIIHCKSGRRSAQAQAYLMQNGFTNVYNLAGGIEAFLAAE